MARAISRYIFGSFFFGVGLFFSCLVIPGIFLKALFGGRKGIVGLFKRGKHDVEPEIARQGYEHDYVKTRSGMRFHYVHAGDEDNPLMLCVHGFPECWYSWKHVLKKFSSDYYVVAFDMRGYGGSDKPKSVSDYHLTYLINDIQEIIEALGFEKAVLVGHDWGGSVVWNVPHFFPEVVSKLIILNCPNAKGIRDFVAKYPSQLLRSWYMFFFQIPFLPEYVCGIDDYQGMADSLQGKGGAMKLNNPSNYLSDEEVEVYKHAAMRNIHYGINYYRAMNPIYRGLRLRPVTRQIVQPTLLIWGGEDEALDVRMVPYCTKHVADARTKIIKGASHWVGIDEPEKVNAAMEEFLSGNYF